MEPVSVDITQVVLERLGQPVRDIVEDHVTKLHTSADPRVGLVFLGTVTSDYSGSGRPMVKFDCDSEPSGKTYAYLNTYTPSANDRVMMLRCGLTYVILGKIM